MLTREQVWTMVVLRHRENNIFSTLPDELIQYISKVNYKPGCEIEVALGLAASGVKEDMVKLVAMVQANPSLLQEAGNVMTRGGVEVIRTTLYEFFLGEGDPEGAKRIGFGFALIPNGENERLSQAERYRPHIEALAEQIRLKQPAVDSRPLIEIIKKSLQEDITAALNNDVGHASELRDALIAWRNAVRPKKVTVGMHYKHYTTLLQVLDLLNDEWEKLSDNYSNYDKCYLVWQQLVGYLQRSLPAVDRFAFARKFEDKERTLNFKYAAGSFPDCRDADGDLVLTGLGFVEMIYGKRRFPGRARGFDAASLLARTCLVKISDLQNLCRHDHSRGCRPVCNFLR